MSHYFYDYRNPKTNYRERIVLIYPGTSDSVPASRPSWGGSAITGWTKLPAEAIQVTDYGETRYESGLPVGLPTAPTVKCDVHMHALTGSTALTDLRDILLQVKLGSTRSYQIPSIEGGGSSHTLDIDPSTVIELWSDFGDSTDDFTGTTEPVLRFRGAQRKFPDRTLLTSWKEDTCIHEIQFVHLGRVALEDISPEDLCQYALYNLNTNAYAGGYSNPDEISPKQEFLFDTVWHDSSSPQQHWAYGAGFRGERQYRFACRLFALETFALTIETLATKAYQFYVRDSSYTWQFGVGSGEPFGSTLTFYEQSYDESNTRGSAVADTTADLYYVAAGWEDATTNYDVDTDELGTAYDDSSQPISFGMFCKRDQYGVWAYDNAWDLVVDMCDGAAAKGTWLYSSDTTTETLAFLTIGDNHIAGASWWLSDIASDGGEIEVQLGGNAIRKCTCQIPDADGDDVRDVTVSADEGVVNDSDITQRLFFHTQPAIRAETDWRVMHGQHNRDAYHIDYFDTSSYLAFVHDLVSPRRLYYCSDAGGIFNTSAVPIAPYPQVKITTDFGTDAIDGTAYAWPSLGPIHYALTAGWKGGDLDDRYRPTDLQPYLDKAALHQQDAGIGFAIANKFQALFGSASQWLLDDTFWPTTGDGSAYIRITTLGSAFQLNQNGTGTAGDLSELLQSGSYLSTLPTDVFLIGIATGDKFVDLTVLGVAT